MDTFWLLFWKYMGWIDYVFVIAFAVGVFLGMSMGLGKMVRRVIEVLVAQVVTLEYYQTLALTIHIRIPIPIPLLEIFTFAILAVVSMVGTLFLFRVLSTIAVIEARPFFKNIGGGVVGGVYFAFLLSLLASFLLLFPFTWIEDSFYRQSLSGTFLAKFSSQVHEWVVKDIPEKLSAL